MLWTGLLIAGLAAGFVSAHSRARGAAPSAIVFQWLPPSDWGFSAILFGVASKTPSGRYTVKQTGSITRYGVFKIVRSDSDADPRSHA